MHPRRAAEDSVQQTPPHESQEEQQQQIAESTEVLEAAVTDANKLVLRQNNDEAIAAGVCGVPAFVVDRTHLLFKRRRLDTLMREHIMLLVENEHYANMWRAGRARILYI